MALDRIRMTVLANRNRLELRLGHCSEELSADEIAQMIEHLRVHERRLRLHLCDVAGTRTGPRDAGQRDRLVEDIYRRLWTAARYRQSRPTVVSLAAEFRVSRRTVRQVLDQLVRDGRVEIDEALPRAQRLASMRIVSSRRGGFVGARMA